MEPAFVKAASDYGALGIVAMVVAWLLIKTIPALMQQLKEQQTEFNAMLDAQRGAFINELNQIRIEHRKERKDDRDEFHRVLEGHTAAIRELTEKKATERRSDAGAEGKAHAQREAR